MNDKHVNETHDMNRDPISGAPGSHPVGVGVGGAGGAAAGALVGAMFGPIGALIGGAVGTIAGASAGKGVAERIDPTGESEYWRTEYANRPYYNKDYTYDDYAPAYQYGTQMREDHADGRFEDLESDMRTGWEKMKAKSRLTWEQAKDAVRDAFDRTDRTHRSYANADNYHRGTYEKANYRSNDFDYDRDYRAAYRYGTQARASNPTRQWDDSYESELGSRWDSAKGESRLAWDRAKLAARDAWNDAERATTGTDRTI